MRPVEPLGPVQIALMLVPVAALVSLSVALGLGQVRRISIATGRSIVQLVAIGLVIGFVFERSSWYWILILLAAMTLVAGYTAARQAGRGAAGSVWALSAILGAVTAVSLIYYTRAVIGVTTWDARYIIPLGGIMLGNAMTAATLAVERLVDDLSTRSDEVEAHLALGASPWQASRSTFRKAVAASLTPTINAMLVVGIVKLPGMMTGQMLGGSSPFQAAMYQLLILTAILFCDGVAAIASGITFHRRFFTPAWQIDREALRRMR